MSTTKTECKIALPVHANRTNFKHNDLLVPWKRQTDSNSFHRFYHVFEKGMYSNSAMIFFFRVKNLIFFSNEMERVTVSSSISIEFVKIIYIGSSICTFGSCKSYFFAFKES